MTTTTACRLAPGEIFDDLAGPCREGWCLVEGTLAGAALPAGMAGGRLAMGSLLP